MTSITSHPSTINDPKLAREIEDAVEEGIDDLEGNWEYQADVDTDIGQWRVIIKGPHGGKYEIKLTRAEERTPGFLKQEVARVLAKLSDAL